MGMSTSIVGIRPPDEKWQQMKAIWDSCKAAGIYPPSDVVAFFNHETPDETGVVVDLAPYGDRSYKWPHECAEEWGDGDSSGYQIDLTKLPPDLRYIRFYNSW